MIQAISQSQGYISNKSNKKTHVKKNEIAFQRSSDLPYYTNIVRVLGSLGTVAIGGIGIAGCYFASMFLNDLSQRPATLPNALIGILDTLGLFVSFGLGAFGLSQTPKMLRGAVRGKTPLN